MSRAQLLATLHLISVQSLIVSYRLLLGMVMATVAIDHSASIPVNIANNLAYLRKVHGCETQNLNNGASNAKKLIGDALRKRVESINHEFCEPGEEDTFFVADIGEVYRQHMRWKLNLPRIKPFYGEFLFSFSFCFFFFFKRLQGHQVAI